MQRLFFLLIIGMLTSISTMGQYTFKGSIDTQQWGETVYLSIIDDYRKSSSIYTDQIFLKTNTDSIGNFHFTGNELEPANRIYRIHVDNCNDTVQWKNHFYGYCKESKSFTFIANNSDTITLPMSFDNEIFCTIETSNPKTSVFSRIDSIREEMKFAYGELQSEASRKMNDKKWFKTFQDFGMKLNEPLAELYIYSFLSDRTSPQYAFYLEDLKNSTYYDDLLQRLNKSYPNTIYSSQYASELASDKYMISSGRSTFTWPKILFTLLFTISFIGNIFLIVKLRRITSKQAPVTPLTQQEQKIAQLICQDKSNKEIADELFVSVSTVKSHINNIYKKLNVQSRDELKFFQSKN